MATLSQIITVGDVLLELQRVSGVKATPSHKTPARMSCLLLQPADATAASSVDAPDNCKHLLHLH